MDEEVSSNCLSVRNLEDFCTATVARGCWNSAREARLPETLRTLIMALPPKVLVVVS